ncbi:Ceramide glucosyltransferase [Labilithrix luteola]|uniref:Ceramide glucosyltransferase n=1 Tax=Labilithrix luteola TaxID=1391654 RepID=A0A0K1QAZ0_9BACT|nr:glycosyltransferase [Labilithrix luteola]AKV02904.1 Ceramide glucosyltransferase [Labilithrix luteola]
MIDVLACAWATAYAAIAAVALVRARRRTLAAPAPRAALGRALLIRPCRGGESGLAQRLAEAGGCQRVMLAIGSADDAARPALEAAERSLLARGLTAAIVVTRAVGPNHKADQIARCLADPASRNADFVVVADSDVDLEGQDLAALLAPLASPESNAAACWAPPVERGVVATRGDAIARSVLGASLHAFPLLAGIDGRSLVGKLFAVRRDVLDTIGGFASLRHCLGEDVELARRLGHAGHSVAVCGQPAVTRMSGRTADAVLARYTRWLQVTRAQRPLLVASYPLLIAAAPLAGLVLLAGAVERAPLLVCAGALVLVVRFVIACAARRATGLVASPSCAAIDSVVADVTLLTVLLRALVTRHVSWRGATLRLGPGGILLHGRTDGAGPHAAEDDSLGDALEYQRLVIQQRLEASRVGRQRSIEHPVALKSYSRIHDARRRRNRIERDAGGTGFVAGPPPSDGRDDNAVEERKPRTISGIHKRARVRDPSEGRRRPPAGALSHDDDRIEPTAITRTFEPGTERSTETPARLSGESSDEQG